mmetsp:Transcript_15144/g.27606  ORF Transcript_15144/g.27606 Transcript_15144/m.27606 type:complete len:736 (+) Transcript_15144:70-2277(+)
MAAFRAPLLPFLIVAAAVTNAGAVAPSPAPFDMGDKSSKLAAVSKVVDLLEGLKAKVMEEGEEEAKAYNTFACFCKDTTADKSAAITSGTDEANKLLTRVNSLSSTRLALDSSIAELQGKIKAAEDEMQTARDQRAAELKQYTIEEADLSGAIHALLGAIEALKAARPMTLAQVQEVKSTVLMADALGMSSPRSQKLVSFLSEPADVPTENYKFRSGDIITTLEGLLDSFRAEKTAVDDAEVKALAAHKQFIQGKTDEVKAFTLSLEQDTQRKAETQEQMEVASQDLSGVKATLKDDKEYLAGLTTMCQDRAKTWDQRSTLRQNELQALTEALDVVKGAITDKTTGRTLRLVQQHLGEQHLSEAALAAIEAQVEKSELPRKLSLLQKSSIQSKPLHARGFADEDGAKEAVLSLLRKTGKNLHSAVLTTLASQLEEDPFAKVKALIQELLDRLLSQQNEEANQKGWCDKSISAAELKRDQAAEQIAALNGNMALLEAERNKLADRLTVLAAEISELQAKQAEATQMRSVEAAQNQAVIADATDGLNAVKQAIDILERFYKTAAVAEVSLLQAKRRGPEDDAPAVFGSGEAYKGAQGGAVGVIGMLEVIEGDFKRTVTETTKAEAQAQADYNEFMTETGKSLAEKTTAEGQATKLKGEAEQKLSDDGESLSAQTALIKSAISELVELQPACVNTGMTYEERAANRKEEVEALKQALCILSSYQQYGPTGVATDCYES